MAGKPDSSGDPGGWLRIVIFIDNHGLPLLRDLLHGKMKAPTNGRKLYDYVSRYKSSFKDLADSNQRKIIFPSNKVIVEDKFDVTIYCNIIVRILAHFSTLQRDFEPLVKELRKLRNEVYHKAKKNMIKEDVDFDMSRVLDVITDLGSKIKGPDYTKSLILHYEGKF